MNAIPSTLDQWSLEQRFDKHRAEAYNDSWPEILPGKTPSYLHGVCDTRRQELEGRHIFSWLGLPDGQSLPAVDPRDLRDGDYVFVHTIGIDRKNECTYVFRVQDTKAKFLYDNRSAHDIPAPAIAMTETYVSAGHDRLFQRSIGYLSQRCPIALGYPVLFWRTDSRFPQTMSVQEIRVFRSEESLNAFLDTHAREVIAQGMKDRLVRVDGIIPE